jgi:hypothetical protein
MEVSDSPRVFSDATFDRSLITAHNRWLHKTRFNSFMDYECISYIVTDFALIWKSVSSSACIVLCLTLYNWTLNFWTTAVLRMN